MYLSHFGFQLDPFALTPDPRFLFLTDQHREALAHLLYGVGDRGGFVQLTGEVGTGKTMLCRAMLEQVPEGVDVALILNPRLTALELMSTVCEDLGVVLPPRARSFKVLVDRLNRHLLSSYARGRRTVLVIDEAQQLSADVLEQIRLLTNLETATAKLLRVVVIGQPELQSLMDRPELRQLSQRITARYHLTPLSARETAAYVRHRIRVAGREDAPFTSAALRRVHRLSGGIPRLINVICDRALLGAYARERRQVGASLVGLAAGEVRGRRRIRMPGRWAAWAGAAGAAAALGALAAAAILWAPEGVGSGLVGALRTAERPLAVVETAFQKPEEPVRPRLSDLLGSGAADVRLDQAVAKLLDRWKVPPDEAGASPSARAWAAGLLQVRGRGDWAKIQQYNRPAALELLSGRLRSYGILTSLDGEQATVEVAGVLGVYAREEVDRFWTGRYALLWKRPPVPDRLLKRGDLGPGVKWLRSELDRLDGRGGTEGADAERFDEALEERVAEFQRANGLLADGQAGRQTLARLAALGEDPSMPVLSGGQGAR